LVSGWLFSKPKHVQRYASIYTSRGFHAVCLVPNVHMLLNPEKTYNLVQSLAQRLVDANILDEHKLFLHLMSIGMYLYSCLLHSAQTNEELAKKYEILGSALRGKIFDSPMDVEGISGGVSQMSSNPAVQTLLKAGMNTYLMAFKERKKKLHAASDAFHRLHGSPPQLWLYGTHDPVSDVDACRRCSSKLASRGIMIEKEEFADSKHCSHYIKHPEIYEKRIEEFLLKNVDGPSRPLHTNDPSVTR